MGGAEAIATRTADEVVRACERLYGSAIDDVDAVVHVTAVWRGHDGRLTVLRINDATPKSAHDWFVLNLVRARADAVLTSGRNVRAEPELAVDLPSSTSPLSGLGAWRREVLGRRDPPIPVVLTSGRGLALNHPIFASGNAIVVTSHDSASSLVLDASARSIEVVGLEELGARAAIDYLRSERGARTIAIETGPTTSRSLYDAPMVVDELFLSVLSTPAVPDGVAGGEFLSEDDLASHFTWRSAPLRVEEASGPWTFCRYTRG